MAAFLLLSLLASLPFAHSRLSARGPQHVLSIDDLALVKEASAAAPSVPPVFTFDMPVDHFNVSDNRTYGNRYWLNDTFYRPGGPVFFYDAGESGVDNSTVLVILSEIVGNSTPMALARKYNGLAIIWEHRFYGESLPFAVDAKSGLALHGLDAYKYLTNEQVSDLFL